jgi:hypothetical protein
MSSKILKQRYESDPGTVRSWFLGEAVRWFAVQYMMGFGMFIGNMAMMRWYRLAYGRYISVYGNEVH